MERMSDGKGFPISPEVEGKVVFLFLSSWTMVTEAFQTE